MKKFFFVVLGLLCCNSLFLFAQVDTLYEGQSNFYNYPTGSSSGDFSTINPVLMDGRSQSLDYSLINNDNLNSMSAGMYTLVGKNISVFNIPISYSKKINLLNMESERVYFRLVLPYVTKKYSYFDFTTNGVLNLKGRGLGDINLKAFYSVKHVSHYLYSSLSLKLPTGKINNIVYDNVVTVNIPLGSGSTDLGLSLFYVRKINNIQVLADFGYDITGKEKRDEVNFGVTSHLQYKYGNNLSTTLGATYFVPKFEGLTGGLNVNILSVSNTIIESETSGTIIEVESPGITALDVVPFVKYILPYNVQVALDLYIPVLSKWKEIPNVTFQDPVRKLKVGLRLVYRIDPKDSNSSDGK